MDLKLVILGLIKAFALTILVMTSINLLSLGKACYKLG